MKKLLSALICLLWKTTDKGDKPRDFFYSESEKIVFVVIGYYSDLNLFNRTKYFTEQAISMLKHAGLTRKDLFRVKVDYVEHSNWCKYCYYLHIDNVETAPEGAFTITAKNDWTMWKWIHRT